MLAYAIEEYNSIGTCGQQVKQTEVALFELYKNLALHYKPELLTKRGGTHYSDATCETIASIYANKNTHLVVTTKSNGAVPDLLADYAVHIGSVEEHC